MEIKEVEVSKLIPYELNNKKHDVTQVNRIANSIKEFWFVQPIVIDKNNVVVIGHGRLEAAKKLNMKKVPCLSLEKLTEKQIKKLRILDNKLNESERDLDNLKLELDDLEDLNIWDLELSVDDLFKDVFTDPDDFDEDFSLPSGDKGDLEQITFTVTSEQMEKIKEAIEMAKKRPEMEQAEGMGNENSNGNALFVIAMWRLNE